MLEESIFNERLHREIAKQSYSQMDDYICSLTMAVSSLTFLFMATKSHHKLSCRLMFYKKGGAGINVYQNQLNNKTGVFDKKERVFAIDYHPFWSHQHRQKVTKLHYHWGDKNTIKLHRPYEPKIKGLP